MFLEQHGEFKQVEFTPFVNEKKFVENVYFCMSPLPFLQQGKPAGTREIQTCMLHVCMNQLHRQFTFVVFLCGKGN